MDTADTGRYGAVGGYVLPFLRKRHSLTDTIRRIRAFALRKPHQQRIGVRLLRPIARTAVQNETESKPRKNIAAGRTYIRKHKFCDMQIGNPLQPKNKRQHPQSKAENQMANGKKDNAIPFPQFLVTPHKNYPKPSDGHSKHCVHSRHIPQLTTH